MAFTVPSLGGGKITCDKFPNECPFCHRSISPNQISAFEHGGIAEVFMYCPDERCLSGFIAYYQYYPAYEMYYFLEKVTQGTISSRSFSEVINEISTQFPCIYNEAHAAEQLGLLEICGVGYRKALEFLIKDYCVSVFPDKKDAIERAMLGPVIQTYVNDVKMKTVAERAVWLGNDETHYVRKWEGNSLADMKKLIELTLHWIEAEELTKSFADSMSAKK